MELVHGKMVPNRDALNVKNIMFLSAVHVLGICGLAYAIFAFSWSTMLFAILFFCARAFAITAGYHRYYAHHAYKCAKPIQLFYLLFGAASFQNSVLRWASDHRRHHMYTDAEDDPYSITKGFWHAHMGWILRMGSPPDNRNVRDLVEHDPLVAMQNRWYVAWGMAMMVALPVALGLLWGDPLGAFLVGTGLGLTLQYHGTFSVNSFAHFIGDQPFIKGISARNSVFVALITFGEGGGHNRHHAHQHDYRTGIRWWNFDPAKWWIWSLSKIGLAWDLKRDS